MAARVKILIGIRVSVIDMLGCGRELYFCHYY